MHKRPAKRQKRLSKGNSQIGAAGQRSFDELTGALRMEYERFGRRYDGFVVDDQVVELFGHRTSQALELNCGFAAARWTQIA